MDLQTVLDRLKAEPAKALQGIAAASGVPFATLRKLRAESTRNPRYQTVAKLQRYYQGGERG